MDTGIHLEMVDGKFIPAQIILLDVNKVDYWEIRQNTHWQNLKNAQCLDCLRGDQNDILKIKIHGHLSQM